MSGRVHLRVAGRSLAVSAISVLLLALYSVPTAAAAVPIATAEFSGFATGSITYLSLLGGSTTTGASQETDSGLSTQVAFSGASVDSKGLDTPLRDEMRSLIQPGLSDKLAYARGHALDLSLGSGDGGGGILQGLDTGEKDALLGQEVTAAAPPSTNLRTDEVDLLDEADPLAYARLLRAQAQAQSNPGTCLQDSDLAFGLGYVADAELLDLDSGGNGAGDLLGGLTGADNADSGANETGPLLTLNAPNPERATAQSSSRNRIVPQGEGSSDFGLMSETRQTFDPVTLFRGTDQQVTIEVLGEWVLRAVATGLPGGASVHYGPEDESPDTPILSIIDDDGTKTELKFQDVFGDEGLTSEDLGLEDSGISLAVGEDLRAIGSDDARATLAPDGTLASAAVDVVRVKLGEGTGDDLLGTNAVDLRIGHMEAKAQVPAGGIACAAAAAPAPQVLSEEPQVLGEEPQVLGEQLPRTGGPDGILYMVGLPLVAAGALLFRRARALGWS